MTETAPRIPRMLLPPLARAATTVGAAPPAESSAGRRRSRAFRLRGWIRDIHSAPVFRLAALTLLALAVHGYHLGADDAGIYLPAVLKVIHPGLYPFGAEFFLSHASLSMFALIVGTSARLSRLDDDLVFFVWHTATLLLFMLAAWQLAKLFFVSNRARWSAMLTSAATLTAPVAGTALVIMDPYLTARSASTPLTMFAVAAWLSGRRAAAVLWIALAFLIHPLMAAYGLLCLGALAISTDRTGRPSPSRFFRSSSGAKAAAAAFSFAPASSAYRQAVGMRSFLFLLKWAWWEWIGVAAPIAILAGLGSCDSRGTTAAFRHACRALVLLGFFVTVFGVLFSLGPAESFAWLQPMRAFQLIYIVMFLLLGGLLGEHLLDSRSWPRVGLFAALAASVFAGMFFVQREAYGGSRHLEWPWAQPTNAWVAAFLWARGNTPEDAVFALDPRYIALPGEDQHGFRAIARRSTLTDYYKDSGVVSLFPQLAEEWQREQAAQNGWTRFQLADFQRLAREYPVSWMVAQIPAPVGLDCPYRNRAVAVCRIPGMGEHLARHGYIAPSAASPVAGAVTR